ncbi:scavenger receptor cysteine-rich domain superfamily protein-like [Embiotoca jacksoni]|uniref:scavenger receptor cysteine-rich domain superfamily protein-like n=1 Tax=Embiotoca jacksoni TaxID=100190 RepID=UPI003704C6B2
MEAGQQRNLPFLILVSLLLNSSPPAAGQIRLVGSGLTRCSGRVEIYHRASWGTVCDDGWDLKDAQVVCRQLDCGTALNASSSASFGEGTGNIWLGNVTCSGSEGFLTECQHTGLGTHDCKHNEDAGVVCSASSLLLISSVSVGLVLLALLVLLVVCLVHRRTRRVKQTVALVQNQTALRVLNAYDSDEDDYVNVDEVGKLEEDTGREEEEESNDYEEPACEDNHEDEDEGFNANYVEAKQICVCVEDSTEEDDEEEEITSEEENDYENVSLPSNEQTAESCGEYEDIYQNL